MSTQYHSLSAQVGDTSLLILKRTFFDDYLYPIDNLTAMSKDYFVCGGQH